MAIIQQYESTTRPDIPYIMFFSDESEFEGHVDCIVVWRSLRYDDTYDWSIHHAVAREETMEEIHDEIENLTDEGIFDNIAIAFGFKNIEEIIENLWEFEYPDCEYMEGEIRRFFAEV